jgi:NTE family protein
VGGELGITPEFSPYVNPFETHHEFLRLIERHMPFDEIEPVKLDPIGPRLLISAANVRTGEFRVFRSHKINGYAADKISSEVLLASAAVPTLFRAVQLGDSLYWDGVFAQNPPLRELVDALSCVTQPSRVDQPLEVWVIQINPQTRCGEPKLMNQIRDRRNELSGNISFDQEIFFIGHMNKLIQKCMLTKEALLRYQLVKVRVITMSSPVASRLDYESKLSRSPSFIRELFIHGEERGRSFLDRLNVDDADQATAPPFRNIWGQWTAPVPPYSG